MRDDACVHFLQWALPRLGKRWAGFRKPRRQVCRRIGRRVDELGLADLDAYRAWLDAHPDEWAVLDAATIVTISELYRDHSVWRALVREVLPKLVPAGRPFRAWSAGCASGEEPYTLVLAWRFGLGDPAPIEVVGTDVDEGVLERARRGCYPSGAIRGLPETWRDVGLTKEDDVWCVRPEHRAPVRLIRQDLRREAPGGPFDLVLCRNLAFTYFDEVGQRDALDRILAVSRPGGALVTARRERPPGLRPWVAGEGIWVI